MSNTPAAIRQFIMSFFSDQEIKTLCFDYFPEVYDEFTTGMSKSGMAEQLVNYGRRHGKTDHLLVALQKARPELYPQHLSPVVTPPTPTKPQPIQRNPRQVFVSHAHEDSDFAHQLARDLETQGWSTWIAPDSVRPGEMWVEAINRGLLESSFFILVITQRAVESHWVNRETNAAIQLEAKNKLRLIPIQVETCEAPPIWETYHFIPLKTGYEAALRALLHELSPVRSNDFSRLPTEVGTTNKGTTNEEVRSNDFSRPPTEVGTTNKGTTNKEVRSNDFSRPPTEVGTTNEETANQYIHEKTGLVMVRVPAGEFLYGDNKEKLHLPEFWISKTPVTQAHYQKFIEANPGHAVPYFDAEWAKPYNWDPKRRTPPPNKVEHPVVLVDWHDATVFAQWSGLHLPTEQQWEKAARGTDGRIYPWGDQPPTRELCNIANWVGSTTPVGRYSPQGDSPYGFVDMAGNVWEWTDSWYDNTELRRVLRGGAWNSDQYFARAAFRLNLHPDNRNNLIGFRVVARRPPSQ